LETNNKDIHLQEKTQDFLAIWHDLLNEGKTDWEKWHTYEHIPERVGISGFLAGLRYMNYNDPEQCCFTIYEGNDLSVFKSTPYLKRLNNPTPWTKNGYGGALMTIRLLKGKNFSEDSKYFDQLTSITNELEGIIISTLGICNAETTSTDN
jgi:hypothetical protein